MTTYPIPAYAATIWMAGNDIMLAFGETSTTPGHTCRIPNTEKGMAVVVAILSARRNLPEGGSEASKIGTGAEPTQFNIEREMLRLGVKQSLPRDPDLALARLLEE